MNPDLKVTLDIAQIIMLGGLVWGLARMSASVDTLRAMTEKLSDGLEHLSTALAAITGRVMVLEDRRKRAP